MANIDNNYAVLEQRIRTYETDGTFSRKEWQKEAKVSIVISTYNQTDQLSKLLLALSHQTYDPNSIEVIIADDGSKRGEGSSMDMVSKMNLPFKVKYVWQPDKGFRLGKARNEAIKRATYDHIICLDSDMIPTHTYVEDVMKWRYAAEKENVRLVTSQDRYFVNPNDLTRDMIQEKRVSEVKKTTSAQTGNIEDWRMDRYRQTNRLKTIHTNVDDPEYFIGSCFLGGISSFSKKDFLEAGMYDESINGWGGEDTELGVRFINHFNTKLGQKLFFVPIETAAYHLEHGKARLKGEGSEKARLMEIINRKRKDPLPQSPHIIDIPKSLVSMGNISELYILNEPEGERK